MTDLERRLRELHAHVCSEGEGRDVPLMCDANEADPHEAGVCAAWDALRDALRLALEGAAEFLEAPDGAKCYPGGGMVTLHEAAKSIRALLGPEGR